MNSVLKGALFVALGSSCYGLLTTFVKLAYKEDFTVYEVTFAQLFIGYIGLIVLNFFLKSQIVRRKLKQSEIDRVYTLSSQDFHLVLPVYFIIWRWKPSLFQSGLSF